MLQGYLRADGRKGVRNLLVVAYLVECAHHVAREIVVSFRERGVHLIGFPGCYPNAYALTMMEKLCTHPNVGGALLVSLGCEGFDKGRLVRTIEASGRPVLAVGIQDTGGTKRTIAAGRDWIERVLPEISRQRTVPMSIDELTVGTICGGSDATSGLTANPAMDVAFDLLVADGAKTIFEETGELIGMEHLMAARAANPALGDELKRAVAKAATRSSS
jgi:altronate hydrolase